MNSAIHHCWRGFILYFWLPNLWAQRVLRHNDGGYRGFIDKCQQCLDCGMYSFCNAFFLGHYDEYQITHYQAAEFYEETDGCRCNDVPSLYYEMDDQNKCTKDKDWCKTIPKGKTCNGYSCKNTRSTYYCDCVVGQNIKKVSQHCEQTPPDASFWGSGSKVTEVPAIISLLNLPRPIRIKLGSEPEGYLMLPALYFLVGAKSDGIQLRYTNHAGRYVLAKQSEKELLSDWQFKDRLEILWRSMPHVVDKREYVLIKEGINSFLVKEIFLDEMMRIELDAPGNVSPKNPNYKWRSIGRVATVRVKMSIKSQLGVQLFHEWQDFKIFVPYQRYFLKCSYKLTILIRDYKCSDNIKDPTVISVYKPFEAKVKYEPWFDDGSGKTMCKMVIDDHRWDIVHSTRGHRIFFTPKDLESADSYRQSKTDPLSRLYVVIYDMTQKGHPDYASVGGSSFQQRKLCFFEIAENPDLRVFPLEKDRKVKCGTSYEITVQNENPLLVPDNDIEIRWFCSDSNNNPCKIPKGNTKGLAPYKTEELECGKYYVYNLTIRAVKLKKRRRDQVLIFSEAHATRVKIQCFLNCDYLINQDNTLKLTAGESPPDPEAYWKWGMYSTDYRGDDVTHVNYTDDQVAKWRRADTQPNEFVIGMKPLEMGRVYVVTAKTKYGQDSYTFKVNAGPPEGTCNINPTTGDMGKPVFTVTCANWDAGAALPLTYRVVEERPLSTYPVQSSTEELIPNLAFHHHDIAVLIIDARMSAKMFKLPKITLRRSEKVTNTDFYDYIERANKKRFGHGDDDTLDILGELARKMSASKTPWPDKWRLDLLETLAWVVDYDQPTSIESGLSVLNMMMEDKVSSDSPRADEVLMSAAEQFAVLSEATTAMLDRNDFPTYDKEKLLPYLIHGASLLMKQKDSVVVNDLQEEDDNERHKQRVKKSTLTAMESMEKLAFSMERDVNNTYEPYNISVGGLDVLVTLKNLSGLDDDMRRIKSMHTFGFSNETLSKFGGKKVSLIKMSSDNNSVFWFEPNNAGVLDVILTSPDGSIDIRNEPIDIFLNMQNFTASTEYFNGILKPLPPCPSTSKRERSVSVHQLKLPDGEGAVFLKFAKEFAGSLKVMAIQGERPNFESVSHLQPLNSSSYSTTYSNLDNNMDTDFYVGVIPAKEVKVVKPFKFNLTIVRCTIWIGDRFESRGCKVIELQQNLTDSPTLWCRCNHQSWFSANFFLPPHKIVLSEDLQLFSTIHENFYVALMVSLIILFLVVILIWGYRRDRRDAAERHIIIMEDNFPGELYPYVVAVFTGERLGSGTSSRIAMRIFGIHGNSRVHILESTQREVLQLGTDSWFMLKTQESLGKLVTIQLWHNHSGSRPEWYCRRVMVYDITAQRSYEFVVERWFTFDQSVSIEDARMFEGHVATEEQISRQWYYHITGWAFSELRDKHHWASIFTRHPRSLYTRCQRAIIAVCLLTTAMLVSMMFFDIAATGPADVPSTEFSWAEYWIGIKSFLISLILTTVVVYCFQKSKKPQMDEIEKLQEPLKEAKIEKPYKHTPVRRCKCGLELVAHQIKPEPIPYQPVTLGGISPPKISIWVLLWLIFGWIVATCTLIVVSFFLILYGLKFGIKRSLVWMCTFVSGTISDSLFMEPLKMVFTAVLVSLLFKKSNIDNFTMKVKYTPKKESKETKLEGLRKNFHIRTMIHYHPFLSVWILDYRENTTKRDVQYLFVYGSFYILMLIVVGIFIFVIDINGGFYYLRQISFHFRETLIPEKENKGYNATHVLNKKNMYSFFHRTVVPSLHRVLWYNNKSLPLEKGEKEPDSEKPRFTSDVKGYAQGYTSKLLGVPRLRQLRLRREKFYSLRVAKMFRNRFKSGIGNYLPIREDHKTYLPKWKPYNGVLGSIRQLWTYTPPYDTGNIQGKSSGLIPYEGGGYIMPLDWNLGLSLRNLQYLEMNEWVDKYTRAVFLEINLYNNNLKLFSTVRLITEALPCGIFTFRSQVQTASFFFEKKPESKAILVLMGVLALILTGYGIFCFIQFSRIGFIKYLGTFRGFCDVVLLIIGVHSISFYLHRALNFALFVEHLDNSPHDKYVSLYTPFLANENAHTVFGLFTLMLTVCMGVNVVQMISIGRFSWILSKVYGLLLVTIFLHAIFNSLLTCLFITIDHHFYDFFVFQFTFKQDRLGTYQADQNKWFFVLVAPIVVALLKFNLGVVIYFYNTLDTKRATALAIVHGKERIKVNRTSKKRMRRRKLEPKISDSKTNLQKKIDKLLV